MLRLILYEIRKVFQRPIALCLLILIFGCNLALLWYSAVQPTEGGYTAQEVAAVYADRAGDTPEELLDWIDNWQSAASQIQLSNNLDYADTPLAKIAPLYTENITQQMALLSAVREQAENLSGYQIYLEQIRSQAERLSGSSLFAQPGTFSYRNILSTPAAYQGLEGLTLPCADSSGVLLVTDSTITMVCLFLSLILVILNLTLPEREARLYDLIRPTKRGNAATIGAKLVATAVLLLLLLAVYFGAGLIMGQALFGLGDLGRPIQSLEGYLASPLKITVGRYLALSFLAKYAALLSAGRIFLAICVVCRHIVSACMAEACVVAVELALYRTTNSHSLLAPFGQINLTALFDTAHYFQDYTNINCASWPVPTLWIGAGTALTATVCGALLSLLAWEKDRPAELRRLPPVLTGRNMRSRTIPMRAISVCLLGHESRKIWIYNCGWILLLLLATAQVLSYGTMQPRMDMETYYYQSYSVRLAGSPSEEHAALVQEERQVFDGQAERSRQITDEIQDGTLTLESGMAELGQLSDKLEGEAGFLRAERQYWRVAAYQSADVRYVDTTGYDALLNNRQADLLDCGKLVLVLLLALSPLFATEYACSMPALICTTEKSWRTVICSKSLAAVLFALPVWLISFLPRILWVLRHYTLSDWTASAVSLEQFSAAPQGVSILLWALVLLLIRLLTALCAALVILFLSAKSKNTVVTILLSLLLLLLPVVTALLGYTGEWGLLPWMTGHLFLSA